MKCIDKKKLIMETKQKKDIYPLKEKYTLYKVTQTVI